MISFQKIFFPKFELSNSGYGLSASGAYLQVGLICKWGLSVGVLTVIIVFYLQLFMYSIYDTVPDLENAARATPILTTFLGYFRHLILTLIFFSIYRRNVSLQAYNSAVIRDITVTPTKGYYDRI